MDVRLSEEQKALRDAAARAVGRHGPRAVRDLDDDGRRDRLEAAVAGAGWRDLRASDGSGGPLASAVEAALVAEELARGLADVPFLGPTLAADLRRRAGAPAADHAEGIVLAAGLGASGGAVAVDVPPSGAALAGPVPATTTVEATADRTDLTRRVAPLGPGAAVDPVPGAVAPTDDDLAAWTALGLALTTAELVGTMRGAIELACGYATERRQYGSPIGSFQAVQHLLADAQVAMEGTRSAALHAAWAVDALPPGDALAAGALAKAYGSRAVRTVCETAIQVHGGIGNTWECLAHVHLRRGLLSADVLGGVGPNLDRVLAHRGLEGGDRGLR